MFSNPDDSVIREILSYPRTIAVVGCSPKEHRDSHKIAQLLIGRGHTVIPVNPNSKQVLSRACFPDLLSVTEKVDMVDVFRRSEFVPDVADQAIRIGAKILWTQLGVWHEEAAQKALKAGLTVIMNRCPAIEYRRLGL